MSVVHRTTALAISALMAGCGEDAASARALPCDVNTVLVHVCQRCHSSPPADGVPIPLVTYADTQARITEADVYQDEPTWHVMRDLLERRLMPQPPVTISETDRATLLDWLNRGAPPMPAPAKCR